MAQRTTITFTETDEVDNPTASYIYSESSSSPDGKEKGQTGRLDRLSPSSQWSSTSLLTSLVEVFLPAGYPHSVSDDYLPYQIFDSLQAFCSSIAGLLSSRAVLQGVGVGNASASPTSALLLHILQDSSGRVATILFAHRVGTALEPECKMYRLAADVFNDIAMILDCLSPLIPAGVSRVTVLSTAGVLRALCGVAGGSSKASLSAHFSKWGNLAEVNAKDSSQETIISLLGMLVGSYVVSKITSFTATWTALLILLTLHLSMNYIAVRSVQMTSLNRQRANIVFSALLDSDSDSDLDINNSTKTHERNPLPPQPKWTILTPAEVCKRERIFAQDGLLNWTPTPSQSQVVGHCRIGVDIPSFFLPGTHARGSTSIKTSTSTQVSKLVTIFTSESYMLSFFKEKGIWEGRIILKPDCNVETQLKAWAHALLAARILSVSVSSGKNTTKEEDGGGGGMESVLDVISRTLEFLNGNDRFGRYIEGLRDKGWDLEIAALETRSGRRVTWN